MAIPQLWISIQGPNPLLVISTRAWNLQHLAPQRKLVLETNQIGSNDIILIHGADAPTLAHLVEKICSKHGLEEHQILRIKVKIGDKLFNVGLDDGRDWAHILGVIARNGSGAELVFWI